MTLRPRALSVVLTSVMVGLVPNSVDLAAQASSGPAGSPAARRSVPRTPWGDPDLQGTYTNKDESGIPLERPSQFEGRAIEDVTSELPKSSSSARGRGQRCRRGSGRRDRRRAGALVRVLRRQEQPAVARRRSGRRKIPPLTPEARHARRHLRARHGHGRGESDSAEDRSLLRSLHHARRARLDDAGDLRQLLSDRPGAGLRRDPLRDDPRDAHHPARRPAARRPKHPHLHGRRARPLGGQHAGRRDHQFQRPDRDIVGYGHRPRREHSCASSNASRRSARQASSGRSRSTIRRPGPGRGRLR